MIKFGKQFFTAINQLISTTISKWWILKRMKYELFASATPLTQGKIVAKKLKEKNNNKLFDVLHLPEDTLKRKKTATFAGSH